MFLDENLKNQLKEYLKLIENDLLISLSLDSGEKSKDLKEFLEEVIGESDGKISLVEKKLPITPSFRIDRKNKEIGITYSGVPLGHEFESFVISLIQAGGRPPKISDEAKKELKV